MKKTEQRASSLPSECTTIIVGDKMSTDGSRFLCRSSDFDAMMAINYEFHTDTAHGPREFRIARFVVPYPKLP